MTDKIGFKQGTTNCTTDAETCGANVKYSVNPTVRVVGKTGYCDIKVQMWDTIGCEEDNIVRMYNKGQCVCFEGKYYFSKEDSNVDKPGTSKWSDGYELCDLLQPSEDTFVADFTIVGNEVTITLSDGTTFVQTLPEATDTFGHVVDNGDGTYTWINADGSTGDSWTGSPHPSFPADVHVSGFDINGDVATVTLSDGTSFTQTITHPSGGPDKYIVDAVIDPVAGTITYTYNDGTTFTKPHPAGGGSVTETTLTSPQGTITTGGTAGHEIDVKINCDIKKASDGRLSVLHDLLVDGAPVEIGASTLYYSNASPDMQLDTHPNWIMAKEEDILIDNVPPCYNAVILEVESQEEIHQEEGAVPEGVLGHRMQTRTTITGGTHIRTTKAGHNSFEGRYNTSVQTFVVPISTDGTIKWQHEYRNKSLTQFDLTKLHAFTGSFVKIVGYTNVEV